MVELIFASIRRQKFIFGLWLVGLCAAVMGLMTIDVFRQSLTVTLQQEGRRILTADVSFSSRQRLSDDQRRQFQGALPANARWAELTELFAMVGDERQSRLAMVRFVSDDFPLLGTLEIDGEARQGRALAAPSRGADAAEEPTVWVDRDLLTLMSLRQGDSLKVGAIQARIRGLIGRDSSQTFRLGNMAPRVYLHRRHLEATRLVQFGSTFSDTLLAALGETPPADLKEQLEKKFRDTQLQITVPTDLQQGALGVSGRLLDFLGLVGLVTLFLGWIGVYYLGRRWLMLETRSTGILKCLGVSTPELSRLLLVRLVGALSVGALAGGALAWGLAHALLPFLRSSLPDGFHLTWTASSTFLLLLIGPLSGFLLLRPAVQQIVTQNPLHLLQERVSSDFSKRHALTLLGCATLMLGGLAFLQARSWRTTTIFLLALGVSVLLTLAFSRLTLGFLARVRKPSLGWRGHLLLSHWVRRRATSVLLISVSALAGLLSQLLPHLQKTLLSELRATDMARPALFMFDIQDDQLDPLQKFLSENGLDVSSVSPFIRARIIKVNDQDFERGEVSSWSTREQESEARFRNRGVNLSYRSRLSDSEKIIAGKSWSELGPNEFSVEEKYADRLKLKIGDLLRFDVQGVEVEARLANLRRINWNGFEPNFFIQFPDGALNEAPKTWVMTVKKSERLAPVEIQSLVTSQFVNVTSINVEEALTAVAALLSKMSTALRTASGLSLALGVGVFFTILLFQLLSTQADWRQLSILGLTWRQIWWLEVWIYGGLCLIGTILGAFLALAVAATLSFFAFSTRVDLDLVAMLEVWLITWIVSFAGIAWMGRRQVRPLGKV